MDMAKKKTPYKLPQKCYHKGNTWWKLAKNPGRKRIFATPDDMAKAFVQYVEFAEANPWLKKEAVKSGDNVGMVVETPIERPLSIYAFCAYVGMAFGNFYEYKNKYKEFSDIVSEIETIVNTQKLEGAMIGTYNNNIVSRLCGLTDKQEISKPPDQIDTANLTQESVEGIANAITNALNKK